MLLEVDAQNTYQEEESASELSSLGSRTKDSNTDTNNNLIITERRRMITTKVNRSGVGEKSPDYVPSYIRAVGYGSRVRGVRTSAANNITDTTAKRLRKLSNSSETIVKSYSSGWKCKLQRSRIQLKDIDKSTVKFHEKHQRMFNENRGIVRGRPVYKDVCKVHVKETIAAMEARIVNTRPPGLAKPNKPTKPAGLKEKHYSRLSSKENLSKINNESKSSPDPDHEKSFQRVKNLWNQKSNFEQEAPSADKIRNKNIQNSLENHRNFPKTNEHENKNNEFSSRAKPFIPDRAAAVHPHQSDGSHRPAIPPRPTKGRKAIGASDGLFSNSETTNPGVNRVIKPDVSSSGGNSSVNSKAMLFGGVKKPTASTGRSPGYDSPPFLRHHTSAVDGNVKKFVETQNKSPVINRQSSDGVQSYSRHRNDGEVVNSYKSRIRLEDARSRSSTNSSLTSDEEEKKSSSFLHQNQTSNDEEYKKLSYVVQQASLFASKVVAEQNNSRPNSFIRDKADAKTPESDGDAERSVSFLKNAIDQNHFDSSSSHIQPNENKQLFEKKQAKPPHRTAPQIPSPKLPSSWLHTKPSGSAQSSPEATRKPSPVVSRKPPPRVPSRPKRPTAPPPKRPLESISSNLSSSNETLGSTGPGSFNLLDEYNKIAKQVGEEDESVNQQNIEAIKLNLNSRTGSADSSTSEDSGVRTSNLEKEVPQNAWSDFSDEDDTMIGPSSDNNNPPEQSIPSQKETKEVKLHNIAKELLSTEESYVSVLHLIDQVFHMQVREAAKQKQIMPESVVNSIFCHVPAIYQFHSSFLLPQLRDRLANWETKPRLGDIMTQAAPFLKMYSLYVQNFDEAMNTIKLWSEKSVAFTAIIKDIQKTPECNNLNLQHHMLGPVQRVPRYRLLLNDYVKRLPEDSEDREEAEKALKLITVAATHSNETMKKIEKFHKLVDVFNSLADVNFEIVDVSRELVKEGKIIKISARNGEKSERYLYLFTDMLLCCTPVRFIQGKTYKVSAKIDLNGMNISQVKNPTVPFAFCVNGLQKSIEFATNTDEEKVTWVEAIQKAIDLREKCRQTFRRPDDAPPAQTDLVPPGSPIYSVSSRRSEDHVIDITDGELGTRAPRWVKDHEVTMCMMCSKVFSKLLRRRHHCRACGRVVCGECSEHKYVLQYEPEKTQKICTRCHDILTGRLSDTNETDRKGVLEVGADAVSVNSVIADYLFLCENEKKKTWIKTWCVIPQNELCLYVYGAHQDIKAQMTQPLPGFELKEVESSEHKSCFRLKQGRKVYYFASDDTDAIERWKYALRLASVGTDLSRDDVRRLGQSSMSSDSEAGLDEESS